MPRRSFFAPRNDRRDNADCGRLSRRGSVTLKGKQHSVVFLHLRAASLPHQSCFASQLPLKMKPIENADFVKNPHFCLYLFTFSQFLQGFLPFHVAGRRGWCRRLRVFHRGFHRLCREQMRQGLWILTVILKRQ